MLDLKDIFSRYQELGKIAQQKGFPFDENQFKQAYEKRKSLLQIVETKKHEKKTLTQIYHQKNQDPSIKETILKLNDELIKEEAELKKIQDVLKEIQLRIPNEFDPKTKIGESELDNEEIFTWGEIKPKHQTPLDHLELGELLKLIDLKGGVQVAGSRSYILTGQGADLEWALHQFCADLLSENNFTRQRVPTLVRREAMQGTGYLPWGEAEAYQLEDGSFWLTGTSEVGLMSAFLDKKLKSSELPVQHYAFSTCFRREAGSYGKDTKGFYRVHEFLKTEQVIICQPDLEEQKKFFQVLVENLKSILIHLELPFRLVQCCSKELGLGQYEKVDCETWMPSRNSYGETHSCSSFTDYQTRRLNCRFAEGPFKGKFPFSLNSTAVATPRLMIALLEHHQQPDGSVKIPLSLQPYLKGQKELRPS
jgi:seryl-tRNA synthetase